MPTPEYVWPSTISVAGTSTSVLWNASSSCSQSWFSKTKNKVRNTRGSYSPASGCWVTSSGDKRGPGLAVEPSAVSPSGPPNGPPGPRPNIPPRSWRDAASEVLACARSDWLSTPFLSPSKRPSTSCVRPPNPSGPPGPPRPPKPPGPADSRPPEPPGPAIPPGPRPWRVSSEPSSASLSSSFLSLSKVARLDAAPAISSPASSPSSFASRASSKGGAASRNPPGGPSIGGGPASGG